LNARFARVRAAGALPVRRIPKAVIASAGFGNTSGVLVDEASESERSRGHIRIEHHGQAEHSQHHVEHLEASHSTPHAGDWLQADKVESANNYAGSGIPWGITKDLGRTNSAKQSWPPLVRGLGLAFSTLRRGYNWKQWLRFQPLELIGRAIDGDLAAIAGQPLFRLLQKFYGERGPIFTLSFAGFKEFLVVSDPTIAKYILRDNSQAYDKGMLREVLKDIMGDGLIPAPPEIWKKRRTAVAPGFHKKWLNRMMQTFVGCNAPLVDKMEKASETGEPLRMEEMFSSVTLDIIGKAVFNYEFGSVTKESPVVKAVYGALGEAERRSTSVVPYWKVPLSRRLMPNLKKFYQDMGVLNDVLDELIQQAFETREESDEEELQNRDYETMENPSLLRFLVDMRGEDATCEQLRDDLMTMLIAGHETTAAVLTWTIFELSQNPELFAKVRAEIDEVLGDRDPTFDDVKKLSLLRLCVAETLRMYPEPPYLIRRSLGPDVLPAGGAARETSIPKGTDIIISTWNLHRSPEFWKDPDVYDPFRFLTPFNNPAQKTWAGYSPPSENRQYPTEADSDYAFMPFGGGSRRCIGDQFAMMESVATLSIVLQRFDMTLASDPQDVGMYTGATIHTQNGLPMRISRRKSRPQ
jgi:cytochrome P450